MPDDRKRDEQVNFRLSSDELELLQEIEQLTGDSQSAILRRLIRAEHRKQRVIANNT